MHLRLSLRHTPFRTGRNIRAVARECLGHVAIAEDQSEPHGESHRPRASLQPPPAPRPIEDALQILQSLSDIVVRLLAEQAAARPLGDRAAGGSAGRRHPRRRARRLIGPERARYKPAFRAATRRDSAPDTTKRGAIVDP